LSKYSNSFFGILGYLGVILIMFVMYKVFFEFSNQLYSGVLFVGLLFLITNIQYLKKNQS